MRTIHEAIDKVKDTLESKGMKYGRTYIKVAQALNVDPSYSILVRILEKCFRVDHIQTCGRGTRQDIHRALTSEFLDIACYAILAMFESSVDEEALAQSKGWEETYKKDIERMVKEEQKLMPELQGHWGE